MQFIGEIQGQPLLILVDSGSSHCFLHSSFASVVRGARALSVPSVVTVADGSSIQCSSEIPNAEWSVQSISFHSTFKLLSIGSFDMILGMDWLQAFSPMKVDWTQRQMTIPYGAKHITLQGSQADGAPCNLLRLYQVSDSAHAPASVHPDIQQLLDSFSHLFAEPTALPPQRQCDHTIPLVPGAQPVAVRQYRYLPTLKSEIEAQVTDMLQQGIVQPSSSAFSSPVLLVRKKDGSWRFCVDYRQLNPLTVKTKFPIPVIDELLDELSSAKYFSCLDLRAGFNQIRLAPGEEHKTAFQTHWGQFEFTVMAFGLTGAPNTFQGAKNSTLKPLLCKCVLVFFDDILIYSATWEEHIQHLQQVFTLLSNDKWQIKLSKCTFGQQSVSYLGHVVSQSGVATDPSKIDSIQLWPEPKDVKQLRSFLGIAGYHRKFVRHFAVMARPLTDLLKKGALFIWTSVHLEAFAALKHALVTALVVSSPNFDKPFQLQTDASDAGVGAVLLQDGHPLVFVSKALGPRTRGLSTYEKEYLAILLAVQQWHSYLQHAEFTIFTDQRSLMHITDQRLHTPWQLKMYTKLVGLQYRIVYKPGASNLAIHLHRLSCQRFLILPHRG
jgi:hypothetical protein